MVRTDEDFLKVFKDPSVDTFIMYATYIPAYIGDKPRQFIRKYAASEPFENNMRADLINLEADPFVSDIAIAKVYKEHKNVHR